MGRGQVEFVSFRSGNNRSRSVDGVRPVGIGTGRLGGIAVAGDGGGNEEQVILEEDALRRVEVKKKQVEAILDL